MSLFKAGTWKSVLALVGGLAVLAMSLPFDDPAPAVQAAAVPPPFSWNDIFKGPP